MRKGYSIEAPIHNKSAEFFVFNLSILSDFGEVLNFIFFSKYLMVNLWMVF